MSETNAEAKTENSVEVQEKEEATPRRAKRSSSIASTLAKEAEAILKGFGDKEDAPEGRRTTRSSTRGSIAPPACTPPPAKKERKSSTNLNNLASSRRGRPKKGAGDDVKPNSDEQKEEETNNIEESVAAKETSEVDNDVEMKEEIVGKDISGSAAVTAETAKTDETDTKDVKTETKLEAAAKEPSASSNSVADSKGDSGKSIDANDTVASVTPSSSTTVSFTGSTPPFTNAVSSNASATAANTISNTQSATASTTSTTTTTNGTVENACKRMNQEYILNDSTKETIKKLEVTKTSPMVNDEKITAPIDDEKTSISDESNKSVNSSSEASANQSSTTLLSND